MACKFGIIRFFRKNITKKYSVVFKKKLTSLVIGFHCPNNLKCISQV